MNTLTFKISKKYVQCRLDKYLSCRFSFRSRSWWQKQIDKGAIRLYLQNANDMPILKDGLIKASTSVEAGDICEIDEKIFSRFRFDYDMEKIQIIYNDRDFVVINKPPGLLVHPVNTLTKGALTCLLERRLKKKIFLCHRLDRLTSGIMIIALNLNTASEISRQFRNNEVQKTYTALTEGVPSWEQKKVAFPIGSDENSPIRLKMVAYRNLKAINGTCKSSITNLKLMKKLTGHSIIQAQPETGRTHQIRVHLSALNLPIVKDKLYGFVPELDYFETGIANLTPYYPDWHGLHAKNIIFNHPLSGNPISFSAAEPEEMTTFIKEIEARLEK